MELAERHRHVSRLLSALEIVLRQNALWSASPPSPEAMRSVMPFMYDTLSVAQWLQWVFIPRTRALIDAGQALPGNCHIHPLAEHEYAGRADIAAAELLNVIRQIDNLLNLP
ncbi:MAG: YqcC family protein [Moraxellaceae bacterium]